MIWLFFNEFVLLKIKAEQIVEDWNMKGGNR